MPDNITKPDPAIARIDAFRQRAKVSLRDAAPLVGVSYSTLSHDVLARVRGRGG